MPVRIQRKRTKGWRMPANTVYVGRHRDGELNRGEFGNPFIVGDYYIIGKGGNGMSYIHAAKAEYADERFTQVLDNAHAVELYKLYLSRYPIRPEKLALLKGKNLACWCALDKPCHADVLLELANK